MKTHISGMLVFALWLAGSLWWYETHYASGNEVTAISAYKAGLLPSGTTSTALEAAPLEVYEGGKVLFSSHIGIKGTSGSSALRLSNGTYNLIDDLAAHLAIHSEKSLIILSRFTSSEQVSEQSDLGLARGDQIRKELALRGIQPSRSSVISTFDEETFEDSNAIIDLIIVDESRVMEYIKNNQKNADTEGAFSMTRNIHFDYGTANINLSNVQNTGLSSYFDDLSTYMNKHKDKSVEITGHTCDVSSAAFNKTLGLKRATAVKAELRKAGIEPSLMSVKSQGEDHPLADNSTEDGKIANRRVEIIIR